MTILQSGELVLSAPRASDLDRLYELHNDALVRAAIFAGQPQGRAQVRQALDGYRQHWKRHGFGFWMVQERRPHGLPLIGRAGLRRYDAGDALEFGYVFSAAGAGRGLGPAAARLALSHGLALHPRALVVGLISPGNQRALSAAAKLGFVLRGERWRDGQAWHYLELTGTGPVATAMTTPDLPRSGPPSPDG